jgi:hypothetical protein
MKQNKMIFHNLNKIPDIWIVFLLFQDIKIFLKCQTQSQKRTDKWKLLPELFISEGWSDAFRSISEPILRFDCVRNASPRQL